MNESKRKKLEAKGWRVGGTQEFLGLSDTDAAFIEFKLKLAQSLRAKRLKRRMGQFQVARIIHSCPEGSIGCSWPRHVRASGSRGR